jgi:hypothetical protein
MLFDERDNILMSLEKHNSELSKLFQKYNEIKNRKFPDINDEGKIDPGHQNILVKQYYDHRTVLENIIKCSKTLRTDIENLVSFFEQAEKDQEKLAEHISEEMKKYEMRKNRKLRE